MSVKTTEIICENYGWCHTKRRLGRVTLDHLNLAILIGKFGPMLLICLNFYWFTCKSTGRNYIRALAFCWNAGGPGIDSRWNLQPEIFLRNSQKAGGKLNYALDLDKNCIQPAWGMHVACIWQVDRSNLIKAYYSQRIAWNLPQGLLIEALGSP